MTLTEHRVCPRAPVEYSTVHCTVKQSTVKQTRVQQSTVQYITVQYNTVQYCSVSEGHRPPAVVILHRENITSSHRTVLYCTALLYWFVLQCTAQHSTALHCTALSISPTGGCLLTLPGLSPCPHLSSARPLSLSAWGKPPTHRQGSEKYQLRFKSQSSVFQQQICIFLVIHTSLNYLFNVLFTIFC